MTKALRMTLELSEKRLDSIQSLKEYLLNKLYEMKELAVNTPFHDSAPHIVNFSVPKVKSEVLVHALGEKGIFVSTTSACSSKRKAPSKTLSAMGLSKDRSETAIRISMTFDSTKEELDIFLKEVAIAIATIKQVTR
jgi:cysteine desulfurase